MKARKCDRCGKTFTPDKRLPRRKLRYGKDKLRLCHYCHISYIQWSISAEAEATEARKAERELLIACSCGEGNDFDLPAEVTSLKYSFLEKIK